jgi:hypothetical protein
MPRADRAVRLKRVRKQNLTGEQLRSEVAPKKRKKIGPFVVTNQNVPSSLLESLDAATKVTNPAPKKETINDRTMAVVMLPSADPRFATLFEQLARLIWTTLQLKTPDGISFTTEKEKKDSAWTLEYLVSPRGKAEVFERWHTDVPPNTPRVQRTFSISITLPESKNSYFSVVAGCEYVEGLSVRRDVHEPVVIFQTQCSHTGVVGQRGKRKVFAAEFRLRQEDHRDVMRRFK